MYNFNFGPVLVACFVVGAVVGAVVFGVAWWVMR